MSYTPQTFAGAVLRRLNAPVTPANVQALVGWQRAEGGNWNNNAQFNPLNTTLNAPGARSINSVGVKSYGSWAQGLDATVRTLRNGRYGGILSALGQGNNPGRVASAIGASPWGTNASLVARAISGTGRSATPPAPAGSSRTVTTPGIDNSGRRAALIAQFLGDKNPDVLSFAMGIRGLQDTPARTATARTSTPAPTSQKGLASFEGKPVAAWIVPQLQYARARGWKGTVTSGYRSYAQQAKIYNSGVRPAAKPGTSNHEMTGFPGGAVDVSDAPGLARILARKPGGSPLQWAGGKDPVHFSHPHGGSY